MDKEQIRQEILRKRRSMGQEQVKTKSKAISSHLLVSRMFAESKIIMAYLSFEQEPCIDSVLQQAITGGKIICVPQICGRGEMRAVKLKALNKVTAGKYGIRTPIEPCEEVAAEDIDLIFVPGVAFSSDGKRLGRGQGFYDRFLAKAVKAKTIGVCYDFQLLSSIPVEHFDRPVAYLTTEKYLKLCK